MMEKFINKKNIGRIGVGRHKNVRVLKKKSFENM